MKLRRFNAQGVEQFRTHLANLRQIPDTPVNISLLEDHQLTERTSESIDVERPGFLLKRDAAEYLGPKLAASTPARLFEDIGLWSWLSLYYFEDVCPPRRGRRKVLADAHYILDTDYKRRYRHLLATPVRILREIPIHNALFLDAPLYQHGDIMEQLVSRLFVMRIPAVAEAAEALYFDSVARRPRRGIVPTDERAGDLRNRFPARLKQLALTYDIQGLNGQELIKLLGREFQLWQRDNRTDAASG